MSDDNEKKDLTRIEDLSEFLHEDNDDFSDLETYSDGDEEQEESGFMDQATDPDMQFPAEFDPSAQEEQDNSESFNTEFEENTESTNFSSADEGDDFGSSESDDFESSEGDDFGSNEGDDFGSNEGDDFGSNEVDDFGSSESDDFESNEGNDFSSNEDDDFGSDEGDEFGSSEGDEFATDQESSFSAEEHSDFESGEYENQDSDFSEDDNDSTNQSDGLTDVFEQTVETPVEVTKEINDFEQPQATLTETSQQLEESITNEIPNKNETPIIENVTKTPIDQYADKEQFKSPENFNELQKFAKNISYGNMGHEGNPPFSIIIKDIKFKEDIEDIIEILQEFNVIDDDGAKSASESLMRGTMLIPRLGEYSAIHLCHKLRRFDISILMGLTEEVHPPKSYESDDSGIVSKYTVYNTRSHHYVYDHDEIKLEDILTSTTPTLEGYHIREYITVSSEYIILDSKTIANANNLESELKSAIPDYQREKVDNTEVRSANLQASQSNVIKDFFPTNSEELNKNENNSNLNDIYKSLLEKLKLSALQSKGNAIVGVNYNVTPIIQDQVYYTETQYQITCSGSIVWAMKV